MDPRKERLLELLLRYAFRVRHDPPFVLASGRSSPYYVDTKVVTLRAEGLTLIGGLGYDLAAELGVAAVGGLTLGADPIACAIAAHSFVRSHAMHAFVVRKQAKSHGTEQYIEGPVSAGQRVAVVDDVLTTGGSTATAIERIRGAGLTVDTAIVLVDREEGGREALQALGVQVRAVVTRSELLERLERAQRNAEQEAAST